MSSISVSAGREIVAPAARVYRILADYQHHHPRILPDAFSDFRVEQGGISAGTVIHFEVTVGGRTESYQQRVEEPELGRVLREVDPEGSRATTFRDACRRWVSCPDRNELAHG